MADRRFRCCPVGIGAGAKYRDGEATMGQRITIRLDNEVYESLQGRSQELGLDRSFLIREAILKYLDGEASDPEAMKSSARHAMPPEAFALTAPFRAWNGDLRTELRKRFLELLALANVTAEHWPKTKGMREVYLGILAVCEHLGFGGNGRQ